ncbi:MAG TPA: alpha/beta hydrolase-fold protein [Candidatus Sabulitectum sp.]|nr:alpha/beta hydrolase-fold protein [Candidatus Sabulitectum sp.]HPJ28294.1 alpha/beta hydrolase-fold protein [Candidatus Sabulitectum sp.]
MGLLLLVCSLVFSTSMFPILHPAGENTYFIESGVLDDTVFVSVNKPAGESTGLPLVVVLDGEDFFPFISAALDYAASTGAVPELLVAGVDCGNRFQWYTPTEAAVPGGETIPGSGGAQVYLAFLENELVPVMESEFGCAPYTVLCGHSLAGLLTLFALSEEGTVFDGFIASSPSLWWDDEMITASIPECFQAPHRVYVSLGNEDETMSGPVDRYLMEAGRRTGLTIHSSVFPELTHQMVPLSSLVQGISFIFEPWRSRNFDDVASMLQHYDSLSLEYGYRITPPEATVNSMGYRMIREGNVPGAVEAFRLNTANYPHSPNVYDSLGEGLLLMGDSAGALENYSIAFELDPENARARELVRTLGTGN